MVFQRIQCSIPKRKIACSSKRDCNYNGDCSRGFCKCYNEFSGLNCENYTGKCSLSCSGHGVCSGKSRSYGVLQYCKCDSPYTGRNCSNNCKNACSNHGRCYKTKCYCYKSWSGDDCSQRN